MRIENATSDGLPVTIRPFSLDALTSECGHDEFQEILCYRMAKLHHSKRYIDLHDKFKALCAEILDKGPDKWTLGHIDDIVVSKEVQCFDEGYTAGMSDLMMAMTFNQLQITHNEMIDFDRVEKMRQERQGREKAG